MRIEGAAKLRCVAPLRVIPLLRPGWSRGRRARSRALVCTFARIAVLAFVFHVSGAAHLLADVLLDDDMTCVDELARRPFHDSTAPVCPAAEGLGHGHGFVTPAAGAILPAPPDAVEIAHTRASDAEPRSLPPRSIDRPPRA